MGRDIFDPFFVPATVRLRENQTVCVAGIVFRLENPGYGTQKPLFEQEELCTERELVVPVRAAAAGLWQLGVDEHSLK